MLPESRLQGENMFIIIMVDRLSVLDGAEKLTVWLSTSVGI